MSVSSHGRYTGNGIVLNILVADLPLSIMKKNRYFSFKIIDFIGSPQGHVCFSITTVIRKELLPMFRG